MTIRLATQTDAAHLLLLLVRLGTESRYTQGAAVNRGHLEAMLTRLLAHPDAGFLVAETHGGDLAGLLVLMLSDHLLSGERSASEVCWYVDRAVRTGLGRRLFTAAEAWARSRGAVKMQMLAPVKKFGSFYARQGYQATDQVYERRLPCLS